MQTQTLLYLEPNKPNYRILGMLRMVRASIRGVTGLGEAFLPLTPLSPADYVRLVDKDAERGVDISGMPIYVAVIGPECEIYLYPKPSDSGELWVQSDNAEFWDEYR